MKALVCLLLFSITNLISSQDCLEAMVGTEVTVPCGNYHENSGVLFTYRNDSDGKVLLTNTTLYYRLNVTAFDDGTDLYCQTNVSGESRFSQCLSVLYSPRVLTSRCAGNGNLHYSFHVDCPLSGNPPLECSWRLLQCDSFKARSMCSVDCNEFREISIPNYVTFTGIGNCTLSGRNLRADFYDVGFECNATNKLGSGSVVVPSLNFSVCPEEMTIEIRPDVITNDYNVTHFTIEEGNDLSLTCEITGAEEKSTSVYWMYVGPNTNFTFNTNETTYNISTCRSRVPLFVKDIGHNESGTYYCVASDKNRPHAYQKMIKVNVIPMGDSARDGGSASISTIVSGVMGAIIIVAVCIVVTIVVIQATKRYRRENRILNDQMLHLLRPESPETDYDAFISFSESDRNIAESEIKEPLEKKGYKVCWHHDAFVPGCAIFDNMERSINKSRVTIILLSDAFKESSFCMTELQITVRKIQQTSKNCLIPVILQESCTLPAQISDFTYVSINDIKLIDRICGTLGQPQEFDRLPVMNNNE